MWLRYGEEGALRELLSGDTVDVNVCDDTGNTALHKAAANGNIGCIKVSDK